MNVKPYFLKAVTTCKFISCAKKKMTRGLTVSSLSMQNSKMGQGSSAGRKKHAPDKTYTNLEARYHAKIADHITRPFLYMQINANSQSKSTLVLFV